MGDIGSRQVRFEVLPASRLADAAPGSPAPVVEEPVVGKPVAVKRGRAAEQPEPARS